MTPATRAAVLHAVRAQLVDARDRAEQSRRHVADLGALADRTAAALHQAQRDVVRLSAALADLETPEPSTVDETGPEAGA